MTVKHKSVELYTTEYNQFILITDDVEKAVRASGVKEGMVFVTSAHTTTGITVNEALECLEDDMAILLARFAPEGGNYYHSRFLHSYGAMAGNPTGHLKSLICGNDCAFPVSEGHVSRRLAQDIYFCEFDGPQARTVHITVLGE
jgi:secondary thiamine-phosphate synthase enzyme